MSDSTKTDVITIEPSFDDSARALLSVPDLKLLNEYMLAGGKQLAPQTVGSFFELYLNGSDVAEIHRLNKAFPVEAIHWARIKYHWDSEKDRYINRLHMTVREKLLKTQAETVGLLSDMLAAANKKHGDKLKKYIQTGDEKDLAGALSIDSVNGLLKVVEGIQKITGAPPQKVTHEETLNVNVATTTDGALSAETAAKILAAVADDKRKKALSAAKKS